MRCDTLLIHGFLSIVLPTPPGFENGFPGPWNPPLLQHQQPLQHASMQHVPQLQGQLQRANAPITFSGNSLPPFANTGDAVDRRTMCFRFRYSIGKVDTKLFNKSRFEMPAILYKSAQLYRRAIELVGDQEIWAPGILPEPFHVNRQYLKGKSNPIYAVLYDKALVLRPDAEMTYAEFKARLAEYCETYSITRTGLKDENFKTAFQHAGVVVCDPNDRIKEVFLRGVGVAPAAAAAAEKRPRGALGVAEDGGAQKRAAR